ncbi:MAG TPA: autotransporter-associated beta strand repeat-containing protein [Verrucomicrobiae bacterium]|nr:autotransporter-associated beta strand repeat-containing protein [Verrucomicrobiae bacterium]
MQRRELTTSKSTRLGSQGLILIVAAFFLASTGVWAQEVWNGSVNAFWSNASNWTNGVAPVAHNSLTFNTTSGTRITTNDLTAGTEYDNIVINGGQFFLSGNSISLGGTNPQFIVNSGTETINLSIALLQDTTFQVNTGGSNPLLINGAISGGYGITKTGANTMRFAALQSYTGDTTINTGTLDVTGDFLPHTAGTGNLIVNNGGTFDLNNTSANINGLSGNGSVTKVGSGGRILTVGNNNANGSFSGTFNQNAGTLSLNKVGTGTQVLGGSMNNSGSITVNGGMLLFDGTQTVGISNIFTVFSGATLGGTGSVLLAGSATTLLVNNGGTLAPGDSVGLFKINGGQGLVLASNANYAVDLNGLTFGSQYDSTLVGSGLVNLSNSVLDVNLGFTPAVGSQFDILTNATGAAIEGTFAGLPEGSTFLDNSTDFEITYLGGTGNDVVLTVIPEPSSLVLAASGLVMLMMFRRRSGR